MCHTGCGGFKSAFRLHFLLRHHGPETGRNFDGPRPLQACRQPVFSTTQKTVLCEKEFLAYALYFGKDCERPVSQGPEFSDSGTRNDLRGPDGSPGRGILRRGNRRFSALPPYEGGPEESGLAGQGPSALFEGSRLRDALYGSGIQGFFRNQRAHDVQKAEFPPPGASRKG